MKYQLLLIEIINLPQMKNARLKLNEKYNAVEVNFELNEDEYHVYHNVYNTTEENAREVVRELSWLSDIMPKLAKLEIPDFRCADCKRIHETVNRVSDCCETSFEKYDDGEWVDFIAPDFDYTERYV